MGYPPNVLDKYNILEIIEYIHEWSFDEEKEIGNWLKNKFGSEIRKGEAIKITYIYHGIFEKLDLDEMEGYDFLYRPFNNDIFSDKLISMFDFVNDLENFKNGKNDIPLEIITTPEPVTTPTPSPINTTPRTSSSRIANSEWQDITDSSCKLIFGETSYILSFINQRGENTSNTGSYTINGDTITFSNMFDTGSLIGDTITIGGIMYWSSQYKRVK